MSSRDIVDIFDLHRDDDNGESAYRIITRIGGAAKFMFASTTARSCVHAFKPSDYTKESTLHASHMTWIGLSCVASWIEEFYVDGRKMVAFHGVKDLDKTYILVVEFIDNGGDEPSTIYGKRLVEYGEKDDLEEEAESDVEAEDDGDEEKFVVKPEAME